jgi:hypothetical protein
MAGHGTAGSGRMRSGWPHNHGSYLPRGGLCDAGEPGTGQARSRRLGVPTEGRSSRSAPAGTGAEQVWCGVTAGPGPGAARRARTAIRHRKWRAPAGGRAGPARDQAVNQVSARRAGPVTRLPPARPRPAAMCHPVAVVRMAGMIIVVVQLTRPHARPCLGRPALSAGSPNPCARKLTRWRGISRPEDAVLRDRPCEPAWLAKNPLDLVPVGADRLLGVPAAAPLKVCLGFCAQLLDCPALGGVGVPPLPCGGSGQPAGKPGEVPWPGGRSRAPLARLPGRLPCPPGSRTPAG